MWYNHTIDNYTAIKRNEVDALFQKKNLENVKKLVTEKHIL